jgi:hypothetical protein
LVFACALIFIPIGILQAQESGTPPAPADQSPVPSATAPSSGPAASPSPSTTKPPVAPAPHVPGSISKTDRERALGILDSVMKGIQENYYDPNLKGLDWSAVHAQAKEKIEESNSLNAALAQVASAVSTLNDSHTRFVPPYKPFKLDFGLDYQTIWSRVFITRVRPGSDAAAKNIRPGAEILSLDGVKPTRQNLYDIAYLIYTLDPREDLNLELLYPSGEKQTVTVKAKIVQHSALSARFGGGQWNDMRRSGDNWRHRMRIQVVKTGEVCIVKFPIFFYDFDDLHEMQKKILPCATAIIDFARQPWRSGRHSEVIRRHVFR